MVKSIVDTATVQSYVASGFWGETTLTDVVRENAAVSGGIPAVVSEEIAMTWAEYDEGATELAMALADAGIQPGDRVGVWLPDGGAVHVAMVATERAGVTAVGLGSRAGDREVEYLLSSTSARAIITHAEQRGHNTSDLVATLRQRGLGLAHVVVPRWPAERGSITIDGARMGQVTRHRSGATIDERRLGPNDLFLVNSTSGTTGLPKLVTQFENRWFYFHQLVGKAFDLQPDDVFMSLVPAPFGFGLWTAHFTPALSRTPVVVMEHFTPEGALELMERERVTVLCCVSTQFIMMLGSNKLNSVDLSSLRITFTGGEAVPYHRAAEFETHTGSRILQFYGSNETGAYSHTSISDSREDRLTTCGRLIPEMQPRLYDEGVDVTGTGRPGQPACRGPATSAGYYDDPEGDAQLFTRDGWMLMEDVAVVDDRGFVTLTGRKGDFIIRGGKNVSAAAVEDAVGTHPAVALVASVPVPDDVFGERVGAFVVLHEQRALAVDQLAEHLVSQGFSKDLIPEHLFVVDDLPRAPGGKVAKGVLRQEIRTRGTPT
jgi:acyl-CoA synthetase